jgi:excinuclease ABC subunit C
MIGLAKREEEIVIMKNDEHTKFNLKIATKLQFIVKETDDFYTIKMPLNNDIVKLLQRIRDESHRFAVSYHSNLKRTRQSTSWLEDVPGIGPTYKRKLIRVFGSSKGVLQARKAEIVDVLGEKKSEILLQYIRAENKNEQ